MVVVLLLLTGCSGSWQVNQESLSRLATGTGSKVESSSIILSAEAKHTNNNQRSFMVIGLEENTLSRVETLKAVNLKESR